MSDPTRAKATVIVPCRNERARIGPTIESILAQDPPPDEIVVADGCSTDGTREEVARYTDRGVPLRIVNNGSRFVGGGRNAATRAASHEVIVTMDAGNTPEPGWLAAMTRPFAGDPGLELLAGIYHPAVATSFDRVNASVCYTTDVLIQSMDRSSIEGLVPRDFVAGGMCMAYTRRLWERAGGFSEWARKGQDRLFGLRARRLGAKVGFTLDGAVRLHMAGTLRELASRHFYYGVWAARLKLPTRTPKLAALWLAALAAAIAGAVWMPWLLLGALPVALSYTYWRAWRKLRRVAKATGRGFGVRERAMAVPVMLVHDGACIAGWLLGALDRLARRKWRVQTHRYLEHGR